MESCRKIADFNRLYTAQFIVIYRDGSLQQSIPAAQFSLVFEF